MNNTNPNDGGGAGNVDSTPLKTITELTIKRSTWLRGEGNTLSALLRGKDGKMCCLGSFCLAAGLKESDIINVQQPSDVNRRVEQLLIPPDIGDVEGYYKCHNKGASNLMNVNDDEGMDEPEREASITELMLTLTPPVKVTFVD